MTASPGYSWSRHLISISGANPEQQLVAAVIAGARDGCASGNSDDCRWLACCGIAYLSLICPDDVDEREILTRLMADLPAADDRGEGRVESSVQFIQLCIALAVESARGSEHDHEPIPRGITRRSREPPGAIQQPLLFGLDGDMRSELNRAIAQPFQTSSDALQKYSEDRFSANGSESCYASPPFTQQLGED